MGVYAFEGRVPVVDPSSFVHPMACLIGDVIIGPRCYIAPFASLRGDFGRIMVIGDSSVQEACVMHGSAERDCILGRGATCGHGAILHGCTIGENALIGMGTVVLDEAQIGAECLVAAQSLVRGGAHFAPRQLIGGNPAKALRALGAQEITWRNDGAGAYQRLAARCLSDLVETTPLPAIEAGRQRNAGEARPVRLGGKERS